MRNGFERQAGLQVGSMRKHGRARLRKKSGVGGGLFFCGGYFGDNFCAVTWG